MTDHANMTPADQPEPQDPTAASPDCNSPTDPDLEQHSPDSNSWAARTVRIARYLASPAFPQSELAVLGYRFDPDRFESNHGPFWRILSRNSIPDDPDNREELLRWALIIKSAAQLTLSQRSRRGARANAHNPNRSFGRALYLGAERRRNLPIYPELAMQMLLSATGAPLRQQATRALNTLREAQANCDLTHLASLMEADLRRSKPELDAARLTISKPYYELMLPFTRRS